MLVKILATALVLQLASAITLDDCPWSQTRDKYLQVFQGKCYYFNLALKKNYNDAKEICQNEGGNLAMVKSKEINRFLNQELSYTYKEDRSDSRVWIGLSDLGQEGVFRWADGSPLDYEKFASGQGPKRSSFLFLTSRLDDCVAMDSITGQWYDYKCEALTIFGDESRPFICEFPPENHPTFPTEATTKGKTAKSTVAGSSSGTASPNGTSTM